MSNKNSEYEVWDDFKFETTTELSLRSFIIIIILINCTYSYIY